jgi:hypothetical protein
VCTGLDTYEAIVQACRDAWNFLVDDPARIKSIGIREWACVYCATIWMRKSDNQGENL